MRILFPFARSQPLKAVRRWVVRPGATRCSTSGSHTKAALMITTRMTATAVYSMSALAVAITCRAAMNVRPGANRSRPTANALAGRARRSSVR